MQQTMLLIPSGSVSENMFKTSIQAVGRLASSHPVAISRDFVIKQAVLG